MDNCAMGVSSTQELLSIEQAFDRQGSRAPSAAAAPKRVIQGSGQAIIQEETVHATIMSSHADTTHLPFAQNDP